MPVGVHPGRHQRVHPDHPPALTDLQHQGVGGHERIRALVERAGSDAATASSSSRAITLTCERDSG